MTDREYLELAAKAAGIEGKYGYAPDDYYYEGNVEGILTYLPDGQSYVWNPLTDDGDALRLAVSLKLCFGPNLDGDLAICFGDVIGSHIKEPYLPDPLAATRRAIVRAAAEIGRLA